MRYLPINVDIQSAPCLVVGGGEVALRKSTLLIRAGACVNVVAPTIDLELQDQVLESGGQNIRRCFEAGDVQGKKLVIAATEKPEVNEAVFRAATAAKVWVNVVDDPSHCQFIFPAIVDRDPIVIGITSSGQAPVLARYLRAKIESWVPKRYDRLAYLAGQFRSTVKKTLKCGRLRRQFWERVFSGPVVEQVLAGQEASAQQLLESTLSSFEQLSTDKPSENQLIEAGEVYLVGAGPGDPDLLTFKALRLMQQADVVIYDRLVSAEVLDLVRRDAERIYAGKKRDEHTIPQAEMNELMAKLALEGKRVCRLKGGDPFIFGRGGEEISQLAEMGVAFQVVPGITAASGCSTYAGIPLTHRDYAQSVRFVTGHLKDGVLDLPWQAFLTPRETVVFYMGLISLPLIVKSLVSVGKPIDCPIAVIANGTLPSQKTVVGTLATIIEKVEKAALSAPSLVIIGEVVSLHPGLSWYNA